MKLYTEQQLKEAMKTIALHVYDKRESNDCNTTFTINILINNLEPYHSVETNKMITDEEIHEVSGKFGGFPISFQRGAKWYREQLTLKP
jgi:hypothetical protein